MNKDDLATLREQILGDIMPLVTSGEGGTADFGLLMRVIQSGNASKELYTRAYESAKGIEDKDEKLDALLSLLDEVEYDADEDSEGETEESTPEAASEAHAEEPSESGEQPAENAA